MYGLIGRMIYTKSRSGINALNGFLCIIYSVISIGTFLSELFITWIFTVSLFFIAIFV